MTIQLHHADCRNALAQMPADSVDTVISDPPYGLTFMGKGWDQQVPGAEYWSAVLRVTKPGATLLAFGGTRTWHHLAVAIEQAGWEIRDCMMWLYGSGFPKSHNLDGLFEGWGTALKPAWEPIILAMRPLDGTFAANALRHGVAGLAIDAARVGVSGGTQRSHQADYARTEDGKEDRSQNWARTGHAVIEIGKGRWPANLVIDEQAATAIDEQSGECGAASPVRGTEDSEPTDQIYGKRGRVAGAFHADSGGASRFFYCAKASRSERGVGNDHPTVKPLALMRYLCRLTKTPTGGVVLDPFVGSGTTLLAAQAEGRDAIGIEIDAHHYAIARRRCAWTTVKRPVCA